MDEKLCERIVMHIVHDFIPLLSLVLTLSQSTVVVVVVVVMVVMVVMVVG